MLYRVSTSCTNDKLCSQWFPLLERYQVVRLRQLTSIGLEQTLQPQLLPRMRARVWLDASPNALASLPYGSLSPACTPTLQNTHFVFSIELKSFWDTLTLLILFGIVKSVNTASLSVHASSSCGSLPLECMPAGLNSHFVFNMEANRSGILQSY